MTDKNSFLERMNFGPIFQCSVNLIYDKQTAKVMDSQESEKIQISRGGWQGCPVSPLLFDLVIEILAIAVTQEGRIHERKGLHFETKISLYVNDTNFFPCKIPLIQWYS